MPRLADLAPAPTRMFVPTPTLLTSSDDARAELKLSDAASVRRGRGVKVSETEIRKAVEPH